MNAFRCIFESRHALSSEVRLQQQPSCPQTYRLSHHPLARCALFQRFIFDYGGSQIPPVVNFSYLDLLRCPTPLRRTVSQLRLALRSPASEMLDWQRLHVSAHRWWHPLLLQWPDV